MVLEDLTEARTSHAAQGVVLIETVVAAVKKTSPKLHVHCQLSRSHFFREQGIERGLAAAGLSPPIPHMSENSRSTALTEARAPAAAGKPTVGQEWQMFMAMFETVYLLGLLWSLYQTFS